MQIYWARLSNPSAPALFSCRQNSERCPQYFWEIVCSDLFARLVVQKVQILVLQQPLLALSNNRSVSDSFKFFHSSASSSIPCCHSKVPFFNAAENLCHRKLSFYNQMMTSFLAGKRLRCTWWITVLSKSCSWQTHISTMKIFLAWKYFWHSHISAMKIFLTWK